MYQQTFGDIEYSNRRRITRREKFLAIMDAIIPWAEWIAMIQPYYYANTRGRKPKDFGYTPHIQRTQVTTLS